MIRPDLDGLVVRGRYSEKVSLVFQGQLHHLSDDEVIKALFINPKFTLLDETAISEGPALQKGTCLARGDGEGPIYLIAIHFGAAKRHMIKNYESFIEYGFCLDRVLTMPAAVLRLVAKGCDLTGALSRVGR